MLETNRVPKRNETDLQYTWNASSVFPSEDAWEAEYEVLSESLADVRALRDRLGQGPAALADALEAIDVFTRRVAKVDVYARLSRSVDTTNQAAVARADRASALRGQALAARSFVEPELLAIGRKRLEEWMQREPRLAIYAHFVADLFRKQAHVGSAEVEEILGLVNDPFSGPSTTFTMLTNSDFKFEPAVAEDGRKLPLTQGTLSKILAGSDRRARQTAWESYLDTYLAFKNTLAGNLSSSIKQNVFTMRARGHRSTLEMSLFQHNIPVEVFHNLIEVFRANLSTWHRYWAIRRRALGVEKLRPYDIWAPLTPEKPRIPYAQAVDWICEGLAPLGEEYMRIMRQGCLEERWVDIYPNLGKTAGAFSSGTQGTHPFIVMSYVDDITSLGTLAHELGHSMHSYWTWRTQPGVYAKYALFVAEVASNFHQAMVRSHLLAKDLDRDLQIAVIEEAMTNFHRYFLVMPTLARFELEVHRRAERGAGLTADILIDLLADLFAEGYGSNMHLDHDRVGIQWATFVHLYRDYYVYQYATGISGAHALAKRILDGTEGAAEEYVRFLKAGGSQYPLDALKMAGVDLSKPKPVEETFQVLSGLVDRLEALLVT